MRAEITKSLRALALTALFPLCLHTAGVRADCPAYEPSTLDKGSILVDVAFARPLALVGTMVGSALFVALSPFTALAAVPEPHDAFDKVGEILVFDPMYYTFDRPLGCFGGDGWRH